MFYENCSSFLNLVFSVFFVFFFSKTKKKEKKIGGFHRGKYKRKENIIKIPQTLYIFKCISLRGSPTYRADLLG